MDSYKLKKDCADMLDLKVIEDIRLQGYEASLPKNIANEWHKYGTACRKDGNSFMLNKQDLHKLGFLHPNARYTLTLAGQNDRYALYIRAIKPYREKKGGYINLQPNIWVQIPYSLYQGSTLAEQKQDVIYLLRYGSDFELAHKEPETDANQCHYCHEHRDLLSYMDGSHICVSCLVQLAHGYLESFYFGNGEDYHLFMERAARRIFKLLAYHFDKRVEDYIRGWKYDLTDMQYCKAFFEMLIHTSKEPISKYLK